MTSTSAGFYISQKLLILIVVPLGLLLFLFMMVAQLSHETLEAATASQHSKQLRLSARVLLVRLAEADTRMRGYVRSGRHGIAHRAPLITTSLKNRIADLKAASIGDPELAGAARGIASRALASISLVERTAKLAAEGKASRARVKIVAALAARDVARFRSDVKKFEESDELRLERSATALTAAWASVNVLIVSGMLLAVIATLVLYFVICRSIGTRLQVLQADAEIIAAGGSPQDEVRGDDEISRVQHSFRSMASLLAKREEALVMANAIIILSEQEQREYAGQLRSLHLISNTVASARTDPVNRCLRLGLEQLSLDWAFVAVFDEARTELVIERSVSAFESTKEPPASAGATIPLAHAFLGEPSVESEVYAAESLTTVHDYNSDAPTYGNSKTYIAAPIYISGTLYGALGFLGSEPRDVAFSWANRDFVRVAADLIGAAMGRQLETSRLDALAFFDALTGLPNRVLLQDRFTQTLLSAKRYRETFAILYLDLDGFKSVNDNFGHATGDRVLIAASRRFEDLMRTSDTVARLGGDEFVILAPKLSRKSDATDLAVRIVDAMRRPLDIDRVEHTLTVSIGISVYPDHGAETGALIDRADRALYVAKAKGKNCFELASDCVSV